VSAPLLELRELGVEYGAGSGAVAALGGVSLALEAGGSLGLLGESGSGKTSLARAIPGLLAPGGRARGSVLLAGRELLGLPERELRRLRGAAVASLFQEPALSLIPVRRAGDQIEDVIRAHSGLGAKQRRARADALLEQVGLGADHGRAWPHQLSGGQRQRVALARAVAAGPKLLIADEPTAGLDPVSRREVLDVLKGLRRRLGLGLLMISHDLPSLLALAERVAVLYAGRLVEEGPIAEIRRRPAHPYTRGLLAALPPALGSAASRPRPIPGQAPSPRARPAGCAFEPRCPDRLERCRERIPPPSRLAPDHRVDCFLHEPEA